MLRSPQGWIMCVFQVRMERDLVEIPVMNTNP